MGIHDSEVRSQEQDREQFYTSASTKRNEKGWKPVTLRWPFVVGSIALSALAIVAFEILAKYSLTPTRGGGLAFADEIDSFTTQTNFL
jgi:hypothetical protein